MKTWLVLLIVAGAVILFALFYLSGLLFVQYTPPVQQFSNESLVELAEVKNEYKDKISVYFTGRLERNRSAALGSPVYVAELRNNGSKIIRNMKLRLSYLNINGQPIYEEERMINNALKPGFIVEFTYGGKKVPGAWSGAMKYQTVDFNIN